MDSIQPASSRTRRRWGLGMVLGAGVILMLILARFWTADGVYDEALREGQSALVLAIGSNSADDFDRAEERLSVAATLGFMDHYPVFVLNTAQRIRAAKSSGASELEPYFQCLADRDFEGARKLALEETNLQRREFYVRLADELSD